MGNHSCEDGLGELLWTGDCKVKRLVPHSYFRGSQVLCLMSTDGLKLNKQVLSVTLTLGTSMFCIGC